MKMFVVFNTCGISGRENVDSYLSSIQSIIDQDFTDYRIIISSCLNSRAVRDKLQATFGDKVSYNWIDSMLPVNITFNQTIQKAIENFGTSAETYLYIDSGINFGTDRTVLQQLYDLHKSGPYAMTSSQVDADSGLHLWFGTGVNQQDETGHASLFEKGHFEIPIGKTVNLHVLLFDHQVYEQYNQKLLPDVFASHSSEGIFTFITAGINKKYVLHKDVKLAHNTSMDGASSGFRPEYSGGMGWQHTFSASPRQLQDIVFDPEAKECGLGYEECNGILMHDPTKYTEDGYAKDPIRLKKYVLENFYLPETHFNYNIIEYKFIK